MLNSTHFRKLGSLFLSLSLLLVGISQALIFLVVPSEKIMGAIQRIFYFHVGSALACYVCFGVVFIASLAVLATNGRNWDALNAAAAEVAFVFCSATLVSGMIWAKTAWNTWFNWEPRLITFLLLWTIGASFLILRRFGEEDKLATHCAVIGILGASMVPLVWLSVYLMPQIAQLHPKVVERGGLKNLWYWICFACSNVALISLAISLIWCRLRLEVVQLLMILKNKQETICHD